MPVFSTLLALSLSTGFKPGYVTGRATNADGQPLAGVLVRVYGTTDAGRNASYDTRTGADGRYSIRLASGNYSVRDAIYPLNYGGRAYRLPLYLVGENNDDFDSTQGGVYNFVLKNSGLIDSSKDRSNENAYFGGLVEIEARDAVDGRLTNTMPDASFVVTLTPAGRLMDGKAGRVIRATKPFSVRRKDRIIADVPLGSYTAKVSLRRADGTLVPLQVASTEKTTKPQDPQAGDSTRITFAPKEGNPPLMTSNGVYGANLMVIVPNDINDVRPGEKGNDAAPKAEPPVVKGGKFKVGDRVEFQNLGGEWFEGTIIEVLKPVNHIRAYKLKLPTGGVIERNESDLRRYQDDDRQN